MFSFYSLTPGVYPFPENLFSVIFIIPETEMLTLNQGPKETQAGPSVLAPCTADFQPQGCPQGHLPGLVCTSCSSPSPRALLVCSGGGSTASWFLRCIAPTFLPHCSPEWARGFGRSCPRKLAFVKLESQFLVMDPCWVVINYLNILR